MSTEHCVLWNFLRKFHGFVSVELSVEIQREIPRFSVCGVSMEIPRFSLCGTFCGNSMEIPQNQNRGIVTESSREKTVELSVEIPQDAMFNSGHLSG